MRKIGEMWNQLRGHEISDPKKRADHIMHQMLIGTRVCDGNKMQVRNYIADQLKSMKEIGLIEGARRERRALRRSANKLFKGGFVFDWVHCWLAARSKPAKGKGGRE